MGTASQFPPVQGVEFLRAGQPSGTYATPFPQYAINTDSAGVSGRMSVMTVPLHAGDIVTTLSFFVGGTAAATVTHAWAALYSPTGALIVQSTDNPAQSLGSNSETDFVVATPYLVINEGMYQVGVMVAATTANSFAAHQLTVPASASSIAGSVSLGANYGSGLGATAPATLTSPAAIGSLLYFVVH